MRILGKIPISWISHVPAEQLQEGYVHIQYNVYNTMLNCLLIISRIAGVLHSGGSADTNWLGFWWAKCETASKASRANFRCRWIWNCCFLLKRQQKSKFTAASERSLARAFQSRDAESDSCQNQHIRSLRGSSTDHLGLGLTRARECLKHHLQKPLHSAGFWGFSSTTLRFFIRCWGHDVR